MILYCSTSCVQRTERQRRYSTRGSVEQMLGGAFETWDLFLESAGAWDNYVCESEVGVTARADGSHTCWICLIMKVSQAGKTSAADDCGRYGEAVLWRNDSLDESRCVCSATSAKCCIPRCQLVISDIRPALQLRGQRIAQNRRKDHLSTETISFPSPAWPCKSLFLFEARMRRKK